jgi:hypothetical protein
VAWLARRLGLALLSVAFVGGCARAADSVWVPHDEMAAHKLSGVDTIRVAKGDPMLSVELEVTVDEEGRVIEAGRARDASNLPAELRQDATMPVAVAAVRQWRFRPFEREGQRVTARGIVSLTVLPPERLPAHHVPFPPVDPARVAITLERTACFGSCPSYVVTLRGDGSVEFAARAYTIMDGTHRYAVPPEQVRALVDKFRAADFWSLDSDYSAPVTDLPTERLVFDTGSQRKTVTDYAGTMIGMPEIVRTLEEEVDKAADTARWVTGNERTVASLAAERFDFRGQEATKVLIASIADAPEDVPLTLLDRGARLDPKTQRIALLAAVRAGRLRLFDRLSAGGVLRSLPQADRDRLLMAAASVRSPHLVSVLLAAGADSRARDTELGTPLIQAVDHVYGRPPPDADQRSVFQMLLKSGADLEARSDIGWTALQTAYDDPPDIARLLIQAGARVNARQKGENGSVPILYMTDDEQIALLAIGAGADLGLRDEHGRDLRQIARLKGWSRVAALLAGRKGG